MQEIRNCVSENLNTSLSYIYIVYLYFDQKSSERPSSDGECNVENGTANVNGKEPGMYMFSSPHRFKGAACCTSVLTIAA